MRLAAQARAGFYPAAPEAIAEMARHLYTKPFNPEKPQETLQILDPCAGEGLAVKQIAAALSIPNEKVYCCELDSGRTEKIKENIPGCNVIGPASFFGTQITGFSFGIAYVNPPFDHEFGGGRREEQAFADKASRLLTIHGVMVLVCPLKAFIGDRQFVQFWDSRFEDSSIFKFPDAFRPYNEIVVFGRKRRQELPSDQIDRLGTLHQMQAHWSGYLRMENLPPLGQVQPKYWNNGYPSYDREEHIRVFEVPNCWKPHTWKKTQLTEEELLSAVESSPLGKHLKEVRMPDPERPPLPLDKGHLGLMLASGKLDGPLETPNGVHIVRGSSHKVEYVNREASKSEENPDTGAVTTRTVFSQRPVTVIRAVEQDGTIYTLSNEDEKATEQDVRQSEAELAQS